jgi:hypothetical protein
MSEQVTATAVRAEIEGLGQTQELALAALRTGSTFRQAAQAAGVSRPTIYRWMQSDPHFRAAYNAWKQEQLESARSRILRLTDKAVDVVEGALADNDRRVAVHVLKSTGALDRGRRESIDPKVVKLELEVQRLRSEYQAAEAMMKHLLTKMGLSPREQREFIRKNGIRSGDNVEQNAETLSRLFSVNRKVGAVMNPPETQDIPSGETGDETGETGDETLEELSCEMDEASEM